ncbi:MAG: magnesium/cobalt transporter CorA [Deltaproteobacteria bacterium]|nr:magnesium/cobalt transporter CorA [Deltaproteobacteria bacterium]MBN2844506.1 magnesium/cobalt transporter CorA [Deltaproteobacteria bacterium]
MLQLLKKASEKVGLPPGSPVHVGEIKADEVKITLIDYDQTNYEERVIENIEESFPFKETSTVTWINIDGLHNIDIIEKIGGHFGLHSLVQEDIVHTGQRPKFENLDEHVFVILNMFHYREEKDDVDAEQVSIILGSTFVISFQEEEGDTFDFVRDRIRNNRGRIRRMGADYLAYVLIDSIVDNYFAILEKYGEKIEALEEELTTDPSIETLNTIHRLKKEIMLLRRSVWPLREVIGALQREESSLIGDSIMVFVRDLYDHTIQVIDSIDTLQEILSGLQDLYLSSVSNKMNEVMKVLTIFAAIFIPLTFMAGIYGMNFEFMPELKLRWAYPALWVAMITVALGLLIFFKRRRWL